MVVMVGMGVEVRAVEGRWQVWFTRGARNTPATAWYGTKEYPENKANSIIMVLQ